MTGLELVGVRKSYGELVAVEHLDLSMSAGEVVALLGPNGAGKSTTIDILLGLTRPDSGTARVWGLEPRQACRAGHVGAMLQAGGLLGSVTVKELVQLVRGLSACPLPLAEALALARVEDVADQRADRLSGGQAQRVRFALAVAGDPDLLVLDEPTVAMDVATRRAFWVSMRDFTDRGRTVLFATHYLEEAEDFSDRAVLMARGRVVADGPTSEVRAAVGGRTITATVPGAPEDLAALPGITSIERRGDVVTMRCADSDATLRALLISQPQAHDVEVRAVGLEDAFLALTQEVPA